MRPEIIHTESPDPVGEYLDGEMSAAERRHFERRLANEASLQAELRLARDIRAHLARPAILSCPPEVTAGVLELAAKTPSIRPPVRRAGLRPLMSAAALVAAVVLAVVIGPTPGGQQSGADIDAAVRDVRMALGLVAEVTEQASDIVRRDVIERSVIRPLLPFYTPQTDE
jgi:ferric-dicitrate binding protein FerR (iron transport regulator)